MLPLRYEGAGKGGMVKDNAKTKKQLIQELETLRREVPVKDRPDISRLILDNVTELVFLHDRAGNLVYVNRKAREVLGYSREEILHLNLRDIDMPEQAALIGERIKAIEANGRAVFNSVHRGKDGAVMPVEVRALMVEHEGRRLVLGVARDITERLKAEADLRESEAKYHSLVNNLRVGVYRSLASGDGRFLEVNPALERITGYSREELLAMPVRDLYCDPAERERAIAIWTKGEGTALELYFRKKDGATITVRAWPLVKRDSAGKVLYYDGFIEDITERQRLEAEIRENQKRLEAFINSSTDLVSLWDGDLNLVEVNVAALRLFGMTRDMALGKNLTFFFPDARPSGRYEAYLDVLKTGKALYLDDFTLPTPQGPWPVSLRAFKAGSNLGLLAVDITRLKQAQQQLVEQAARLTRSNQDLSQFAYMASHDLQEPLRMVSSYCQLLKKRYQGRLDKDADEFIGFAVDGAERMARLIDALLEYSRVETRGRPLAAVDSGLALRHALANLEVARKESAATVTTGPLPLVKADAAQLEEVFQNLVGNAIKFRTPERAPQINVSAERAGDRWRFAVRDNGIGIAPEYQARIFEMFFRLHHTEAYPGTGLGLPLCRKIVERHGGQIGVESVPGAGSTFYFTIGTNEEGA
jgi:PAS domain S-box-containing protein